MDRRPLLEINEIVYEYDRKHSQQLVYVAISSVIFNTLFNIIRMCRPIINYIKKIKYNNTEHFSYTNCSLNTNI